MTLVERNVKPGKTAMTPEQRRQRQLLLNQLVYEMEDEKARLLRGLSGRTEWN